MTFGGRRGISASRFNREIVDLFFRALPRAGARILVEQVSGGWRVSLASGARWRHPWFTEPSWNLDLRRWEARVRPGFVNGWDPLVQGAGEDGVEIPLLEEPAIPLRGFRALGGDEGDEAPAFFRALGVPSNTSAVSVSATGVALDATDRSSPADLPPRRLRAVDVVLSVARAALTGRVEIVDPTGTSGQEVLYRVGYETAQLDRQGGRARLRLASKYESPRRPTLEERLLGLYSDPTEDTRLIATVYLLSPANALGEPDGSWTPYVAHSTFWNLKHAARNALPVEPPAPIRLFTGLAGGIGDAIGNQILAQINEFSDRVNNAVNNVSNEGKFWTV